MADDRYYQFGNAWVRESQEGSDVVRMTYTADPRVDPAARLDSTVRVFPNGSYQTTTYDGDGVPTLHPIES